MGGDNDMWITGGLFTAVWITVLCHFGLRNLSVKVVAKNFFWGSAARWSFRIVPNFFRKNIFLQQLFTVWPHTPKIGGSGPTPPETVQAASERLSGASEGLVDSSTVCSVCLIRFFGRNRFCRNLPTPTTEVLFMPDQSARPGRLLVARNATGSGLVAFLGVVVACVTHALPGGSCGNMPPFKTAPLVKRPPVMKLVPLRSSLGMLVRGVAAGMLERRCSRRGSGCRICVRGRGVRIVLRR